MALLNKKKFSFVSKGMDEDTFSVISFKGFEAISKPYEFEILIVSEKTDVDPLKVLQNPARFTIHRDEEENVDFNGILIQFDETHEFNGNLFFKAVLAPKLWWLNLTHHNQVFLNSTAPQIMENSLKDGGLLPGLDFDFRIQNTYLELDYVCQYGESHFNFVSRWAEREGIYYFFEQTANGEKVIFTDTKLSHTDLMYDKDLFYRPPSGLDALHTREVIKNFICRHSMLPRRVYLKDYNYLRPSLAIEGMADVDENGRGENYIYGENHTYGDEDYDTPSEGNRLAGIRAEALLCRKSLFYGESSVPFIEPGYTFDLNDHYKETYNKKYLVTDVTHQGHQTGYLISGVTTTPEKDEEMFYSNSFTAIYSDAQFRPESKALKPKISGTINAKIDAAASGEYAELDELGRYKVILPFDRSGRHNGKASAFLRMMQPYAGQNQGMHFPLHKGTEVLLTFIEGNPDRPLIAGAVPNPETSSPVTSGNQTKSVITTGRSKVDQSVGAATYGEDVTGTAEGLVKVVVDATDTVKDNYIEFNDASNYERIRIHSDGNLWLEALGRYGEYTVGGDVTTGNDGLTKDKVPTDLKYLWGKFFGTAPGFAPTGMLEYTAYSSTVTGSNPSVDTTTMATLAKTGKLKLTKGDTFITQDGNVYDFGGYWVYNLGNCYIENHMGQKAALNKTFIQDFADVGGPNWNIIKWPTDTKSITLPPPPKKEDPPGSGIFVNDTEAIEKQNTFLANLNTSSPGRLGSATNDIDCCKWDEDSQGRTRVDWVGDVWVEKKFGNSYDYAEGSAVSVRKGDTLDIAHGGQHTDIVYRGDGSVKSLSIDRGRNKSALKEEMNWTSGGTCYRHYKYWKGEKDELQVQLRYTDEKKYVRDGLLPGTLLSHTYKVESLSNTYTFTASHAATESVSFKANSSASFAMYAGAHETTNVFASAKNTNNICLAASLDFTFSPIAIKQGIEIYGGYKGDFKAFLGVKTDISFSASLALKVNLSASFYAELKGAVAGYTSKDIVTQEVTTKTWGVRAQQAAAINAKLEKLALKKVTTEMKATDLLTGNTKLYVKFLTSKVEWSDISIFA